MPAGLRSNDVFFLNIPVGRSEEWRPAQSHAGWGWPGCARSCHRASALPGHPDPKAEPACDWYDVCMSSPDPLVKEKSAAVELVEQFVASTHVFSMAVSDVLEQRVLRDLAEAQLTCSQLRVLRLVSQFPDQTVDDIAAFLGISSAAASQAVGRLARRKLLGRRAGELALTAAGRGLLDDYQSARKRRLGRIFRQFPAAELRKTAELLDRLAGAIVMQSGDPEELCLQCSIYLRNRCLLQEVVRRSCSHHQRKGRKPGPPPALGPAPVRA